MIEPQPKTDRMPRCRLLSSSLVGLLVTVLCLFYDAAATAGDKRYALPGHGSIDITVPETWGDRVDQPPGELPPTIVLHSADPTDFQVLITPFWNANNDTSPANEGEIKALIENFANQTVSHAVEQTLPLQGIEGSAGRGFYFSATDREPKPGEYLYLTQGAMAVDDLSLAFTILTNPGGGDVHTQALEMIQGVRRNRH